MNPRDLRLDLNQLYFSLHHAWPQQSTLDRWHADQSRNVSPGIMRYWRFREHGGRVVITRWRRKDVVELG